jgi:hypothetical protein
MRTGDDERSRPYHVSERSGYDKKSPRPCAGISSGHHFEFLEKGQMANYDVDFSYSNTGTPDVIDTHMVMYSVLGVPAQLAGKALLDHIEARLRRDILAIAKIEGLHIRGS